MEHYDPTLASPNVAFGNLVLLEREGITMSKPGPKILLSIVDEVLRLQSGLERIFADLECLSGLSTLQKLVLSCVLEAPVAPTVPQIGRNLGHSRQVIQRIVNELVTEELVEKTPNPHHRRAPLLVPTGYAKDLAAQAEQRAGEAARAFLKTINADRCDALTRELRQLSQAIEAYWPAEAEGTGEEGQPLTVTGALALL